MKNIKINTEKFVEYLKDEIEKSVEREKESASKLNYEDALEYKYWRETCEYFLSAILYPERYGEEWVVEDE